MKKNNSSTIKYLIVAGVYIAAIILVIIFGLMPKLSELSKNQNDLEKKKQELSNTIDKRAVLEQLSKDKSRINLVNSVTLEYLPEKPNTSDFVVKVEALAKELNVVVSTFSFTVVKTETVKKTDSEENSSSSKKTTDESSSTATKTTQKTAPQNSSEFTMVISADYSQLSQFLEKIESFPRVNVVDSINISSYNKLTNTMSLKIVGRIFYGS